MPWVLTAAILGFAVVAVTQVSYEVEGWGVGELVVADARVVWHELPWPRAGRPPRDRVARPQDPSQTPTHPGRGRGSVVSPKASSPDRGFGPYGSYGTGYKRRLLALEGYGAL